MAQKEKRGLGAGLDALFAANGYEEEDSIEQTTLPIGKVEPRADQPRVSFDEEQLQELADSIAQYGIIQPITVRKLDSGYYQIIAGERRWRAARMAGQAEIPVRIIEADDKLTAELALVENLQRSDLNPIEEAKGYQSLMRDYGLTQEETAHSVGRSRPAITNAIRLLNLCPAVLKLVEDGKLSAGHARALLPLERDEVQLKAAEEVIQNALSVRKTEALVAKLLKEPRRQQQEKTDSIHVDYAAEVSTQLSKVWGRKVRLTDGRKIGKIEIEYYGAEDRETLIELLSSLKK